MWSYRTKFSFLLVLPVAEVVEMRSTSTNSKGTSGSLSTSATGLSRG
jgi:hypothetical protein